MMDSTLIGGVWSDPLARRSVTNPADGTDIGSIGYGGKAEAIAAVAAAERALPQWAALPPRARADLLLAGAARLTERADEIGLLLCRESGKRLPEAVAEVRFAVEYLRWFAEEARRPIGTLHAGERPGRRQMSMRVPAGVAVTLTPWNFPVSIQARKLAPALAAGCTVVARPSEQAPLAVVEMFRCLTEAGLPAGVLNLVHGPAAEITDALLSQPAVRVVSFTGSTGVGRRIMAAAAENIVRPLLELGGDAAYVVFDDADIPAAVEGAMTAKFRNNGQSCIAANRFVVHEAVHDEFVAQFVARISAMKIGDPAADPCPDLGPLIDAGRVEAVSAMVAEAVGAGARLASPHVAVPARGTYLAPALLTDVPAHCALATTEVFGPAAAVFRFSTEDEAVALANDTRMGLAGYVYTRDAGRAWRMGERIRVGILGINDPLPSAAYTPMGGMGQSGLGREGAEDGLHEFQETRSICQSE